MITRPDINDHKEVRNYVKPDVRKASLSSCDERAEAGAKEPCQRIDRDQENYQPALARQTRSTEKQSARRRIHEIVFPGIEKIDFMICEHVLTRLVPQLVIEQRATVDIA